MGVAGDDSGPAGVSSDAVRAKIPNRTIDWLRLWFRVDRDVGPVEYAASGFGLMAFKYAVEAGLIYAFTGHFFSPLMFLSPMLNLRQGLLGDELWIGWFQFFWTLPFVWIAFSMSVRRAANAGWSPWLGILVLVPIVNYVLMLLLSVRATQRRVWSVGRPELAAAGQVKSALLAVLVSSLISLMMVGLSIYVVRSYGATLFFATPLVMGAVSGFVHNRNHSRSVGSTLAVGILAMGMAGFTLLLFALEGMICLLMAAPLVLPLALIGGLVGKAIADYTVGLVRDVAAVVFFLPGLCGAESWQAGRLPIREVRTMVEIDAPPDVVWEKVLSFPELPPPREWYFRAGIAYPTSARLDGYGVGAVRHCIFSTGEFVEPITVWDEPRRLAFDVTDQPEPMQELSPFDIHPPHLDGTLRSRRGEFLLVALPGDRTRLEGRTWYDLDMFPQSYWTLWSDLIIHRIHRRVLEHIRSECERSEPVAATHGF